MRPGQQGPGNGDVRLHHEPAQLPSMRPGQQGPGNEYQVGGLVRAVQPSMRPGQQGPGNGGSAMRAAVCWRLQ